MQHYCTSPAPLPEVDMHEVSYTHVKRRGSDGVVTLREAGSQATA